MEIKAEIEKIFRESNSPEELFDAFEKAIALRTRDSDLYKILLANPALSPDEIKLFTEKVCYEFKDLCYELYLWTAKVFESSIILDNVENAFNYYSKALNFNAKDHNPYLSIISLYNSDLDFPPKTRLFQLFNKGLSEVQSKSKLCSGIAEFCDKINDYNLKKKYLVLAAKFSRQGF